MRDEVIIKVENLWKQYGLPLPKVVKRFRQRLRGERLSSMDHWALKDISIEVRKGETLGIIGPNGAGKSTLLKVLAGVTPATRGKVRVKGKIFPMIELNAGIHPELTGRENVRLLGAIMGFSRQEIEVRLPQIEEFTELGEWFNRPVRKYSSGMLARLGFGVAMNIDADVLLVDEVLAVGDLRFQRKCYKRMQKLQNVGITVLFVSHNIRQIERLCETAIILDSGKLLLRDTATRVAEIYYNRIDEDSRLQIRSQSTFNNAARFMSSGELFIEHVEIQNLMGKCVDSVSSGEGVRLALQFKTTCAVKQPIIGIGFVSTDMITIASFSNDGVVNRPSFNGVSTVYCTIPKLPLNPGVYSIRVKVVDCRGSILFVGHELVALQVVRADNEREKILPYGGFLRLDVIWETQNVNNF